MKIPWKELLFSLSILWMISFGTTLVLNDLMFLGYLNFIGGSLAVYYLCVKYFQNETLTKLKRRFQENEKSN